MTRTVKGITLKGIGLVEVDAGRIPIMTADNGVRWVDVSGLRILVRTLGFADTVTRTIEKGRGQ